MDHQFRKERRGLLEYGAISEQRSREEFQVLMDPYAADAISRILPVNLFTQLKGWARSFYSLEQHVDAILAYDKPKLPEPTDVAWNQTKQHCLTMFRRMDRIYSMSYKNFDKVKWISASSAGYGYIGHKGDNDNYKRARKTAVTIAETLDHRRSYGPEAILESTPDRAFTRTQLSQIKVKRKVRNVWGEAFHYVLLEGLFADPLIEYFRRRDTFYFIGQDPLYAVPLLIENILREYDYIYMLDWSAFDASVQEWEIRFAFSLLETLLVFPSNVEAQIWRFIIELFIYRKIAGPNQVMYLKTQGIPSGSCFTNIIGSITNYVRIQYIFRSLTGEFAPAVYTHGDDSLIGVPSTQYVPMARLNEVCSPLHWTVNILKSEVSHTQEGTTFLSRTVKERQNARDELTCLRMLMYPEFPVTEGAVSTLRAHAICRDAGVNSHYLYEIFTYLQNKYGIASSMPAEHRKWNEQEFQSMKISASELL